jgi:hypothetical protein
VDQYLNDGFSGMLDLVSHTNDAQGSNTVNGLTK